MGIASGISRYALKALNLSLRHNSIIPLFGGPVIAAIYAGVVAALAGLLIFKRHAQKKQAQANAMRQQQQGQGQQQERGGERAGTSAEVLHDSSLPSPSQTPRGAVSGSKIGKRVAAWAK